MRSDAIPSAFGSALESEFRSKTGVLAHFESPWRYFANPAMRRVFVLRSRGSACRVGGASRTFPTPSQ